MYQNCKAVWGTEGFPPRRAAWQDHPFLFSNRSLIQQRDYISQKNVQHNYVNDYLPNCPNRVTTNSVVKIQKFNCCTNGSGPRKGGLRKETDGRLRTSQYKAAMYAKAVTETADGLRVRIGDGKLSFIMFSLYLYTTGSYNIAYKQTTSNKKNCKTLLSSELWYVDTTA